MSVTRLTIAIALLGALLIGAGIYRMQGAPLVNVHNELSGGIGERGTGKTEEVPQDNGLRRYTNSEYGFSFFYPSILSLGQFSESNGETIVLQGERAAQSGFQIYVFPVTEPVVLTPGFIEADLPGTVVTKPQKIELDGKAQGIMFESNNPAFSGKSFEIWFYYNGFVYQATSYLDQASLMQQVIGTLRFE